MINADGANNVKIGKHAQTILGNRIKATDVNRYPKKANKINFDSNPGNESFFEKNLRASLIVEPNRNALKTYRAASKTCVPVSETVNEYSKTLTGLVTSLNYVNFINNGNANVTIYNKALEGKIYPKHVMKCETDPFNVVLLKVTELHESITKNSRKMIMFECSNCKYYCIAIENFYSHLKSKHHADRIKFMNIEYVSRIVLRASISKVDNFHCSICEIKFQNSIILKQHRIKTSFQCLNCNRDYDNCLKWKEHMIVCNSEKHIRCNCGMQFTNYAYYRKHKPFCKESETEAYLCVMCQLYFENMEDLVKHQKIFHPERSEHKIKWPVSTCLICGIKYVGNKKLHNCKKSFQADPKCPVCLQVIDLEMLTDNNLNDMVPKDMSSTVFKKLFISDCAIAMHNFKEGNEIECTRAKDLQNSLRIGKIKKNKTIKTYVKKNETIKTYVKKNETIKTYVKKNETLKTYVKKNETLKTYVKKNETIKTYVKKKPVFSETPTKKDCSVNKKRALQESVRIELDIEDDLINPKKEKKRRLEKAVNDMKAVKVDVHNIQNSQSFHYINQKQRNIHIEKYEEMKDMQEQKKHMHSDITNLQEMDILEENEVLGGVNENREKPVDCKTDRYMQEHAPKIVGNEWKVPTLNFEEQVVQNTVNREKISISGSLLTEAKDDIKAEPLEESIAVDSVTRFENLEKAVGIDIKKEEINYTNEEENFTYKDKEKRGQPQKTLNNAEANEIDCFNERYSQVIHVDQQFDILHPSTVEEVADVKKGEYLKCSDANNMYGTDCIKEENETLSEEKNLDEMREVTDFDIKRCSSTHVFQCKNTSTKSDMGHSQFIEVKIEIKCEPVDECVESDIVTISDGPVHKLQTTSDTSNTIVNTGSNNTTSKEKSSIDDESIVSSKLMKSVEEEQKPLDCSLFSCETLTSEDSFIIDKKSKNIFDSKCTDLRKEVNFLAPNFIKQKHICSLCKRTFKTLIFYYDHYIYHNLSKYQCPYCKVLNIKGNFYLHCCWHVILNYHKSVGIGKSARSECKQCADKVKDEHLLLHYEHHSLVNIEQKVVKFPKNLLDTVVEDLRRKETLCVICEKNYKDLRQHLIGHLYDDAHANKDENGGLFCQVCKELMLEKGVYEKHMLQHSSSETYECQICHRLYNMSSIIQYQQQHKNPLVWCEACKEKFTSKKDLVHHLTIEDGRTVALCLLSPGLKSVNDCYRQCCDYFEGL
ncbi:Zinc finger protein 584 [Eumeta japonica]|uniref:Zinc finger protein 584 n=1 Tax=Eumeta variegata TaxID=151549 RepID=A0A4C1WIR3_EUMVA|nr:Zinc finger protein 584 [Eumeta japonica]